MIVGRVEAADLRRLDASLTRWRKRVKDDLLRRVGDRIALQTRKRTRSPDGQSWEPRKEPTGTWPLLDKSGKMRAGIKYHRQAQAECIVSVASPYAKFIQGGTKNMVAREFAGVGSDDTQDLERLIQTWVDRRLR